MGQFIDLTGQRFGRLTVIERAKTRISPNGRHRTMWLSRCECGKTVEVVSDKLRSGRTQSCGCLNTEITRARYVDVAGMRFGRLTALEKAVTNGKLGWRCRCDCGEETTVVSGNLRYGLTASCGCTWKEQKGAKHWNWGEEPNYKAMHQRVRAARGRAVDHRCIDCGQPAEDWSCRRDVPLVCTDKRYYSLNVEHYDPRCKPCHGLYDRKNRTP